MGYEENNPQDIETEEVFNLLRPIFSDIKKSEIKFFYHGTYNTFFVKDEYIFRFPDKALYNKKGYKLITREVEFLDTIRKLISIQIPQPLIVSEDESSPFVGYKKIPGISLSRVFSKTKDNEKEKIGKEIASFLTKLHSKEIFNVVRDKFHKDEDLSTMQYRKKWQEYRMKMEKLVYPQLRVKERKWHNSLFDNFLEKKNNFVFLPTVTHGDFDTSNILVNPENYEITGIIDFEDASIGDPAYDLGFIDEGKLFFNAVFENYEGFKDSAIKERIKFYYCRAGSIYIITGIEFGYPQMIEYGQKLIKQRMKVFQN